MNINAYVKLVLETSDLIESDSMYEFIKLVSNDTALTQNLFTELNLHAKNMNTGQIYSALRMLDLMLLNDEDYDLFESKVAYDFVLNIMFNNHHWNYADTYKFVRVLNLLQPNLDVFSEILEIKSPIDKHSLCICLGSMYAFKLPDQNDDNIKKFTSIIQQGLSVFGEDKQVIALVENYLLPQLKNISQEDNLHNFSMDIKSLSRNV